tara:strand:+ start:2357 stop:2818 length:462 start_codon:yes stop_codon:yes gene_type:complete
MNETLKPHNAIKSFLEAQLYHVRIRISFGDSELYHNWEGIESLNGLPLSAYNIYNYSLICRDDDKIVLQRAVEIVKLFVLFQKRLPSFKVIWNLITLPRLRFDCAVRAFENRLASENDFVFLRDREETARERFARKVYKDSSEFIADILARAA